MSAATHLPAEAPAKTRYRLPRWICELLRFCALMVATSVITFALVGLSPIDPVQMNLGQASYARMSAEQRAELVSFWGADLPIWERYFAWLSSVLAGNLGQSLRFNAPVLEVLAERAGSSLALMLSSWVFSGLLGLALGSVAGTRRGHATDRMICAVCYVLSSAPAFWFALLALMIFAVWLGWFPVGFSVPIGVRADQVSLAARVYHLVLPVLVLSLTNVAPVALHTREKLIDVYASDYIRFASSRGERPWTLFFRHGLRNLVLPAISLQMASIGEIFGGSVLVEQIFSYPGLGQAAVVAGLGGDAPLLVAIALVSAALVFAGNLAANLLYGVVDPRVREGAHHVV